MQASGKNQRPCFLVGFSRVSLPLHITERECPAAGDLKTEGVPGEGTNEKQKD